LLHTQSPTRDAAIGYAIELGWHVFPCRPRGKEPLTVHGLHDASNDPAKVAAMFHRDDANIGLNCGASGIFVVDLDGAAGSAQLDQFPETRTAKTPRGFHLLYAGEARTTSGTLGEGIDTRGRGGYIILPPSVHPSGQRYEWLDETRLIEELPEQIIDRLDPPRRPPPKRKGRLSFEAKQSALAVAIMRLRAAKEGERNFQLNRLTWVCKGLWPDEDLARLFCEEGVALGLPERECIGTVASALGRNRREVEEWVCR
jgi:hypothetical protein